jgi:membrane protease YdiL (CAAX protease family)
MSNSITVERATEAPPSRQPSGLLARARFTFINRHAVLIYYVLTFAISVGGVFLLVGGPGNIPGSSEQIASLFPIALLVTLAGPSIAGLLLTGLVDGKPGFRELLVRLLRWRVAAGWYALALLTFPVLATISLFSLSLTSPIYLPAVLRTDDRATLILSALGVGLVYALFEELGWTGFAIPRLRLGHAVLTTGVIVGALWGAWHVPVTFWASGDSAGAFSPTLFLPPTLFYVAVLPAYRILMVWVYDRTCSLLVATLMHSSLIVFSLFLLVPMEAGLVNYYLMLATAMWAVVAVVSVTIRRQPQAATHLASDYP